MDLFDTENSASGFRLIRLEVFNWGTFDGKIGCIRPEGDSSFLTGRNASGKTTLVDAVLTLLIPAAKRYYNRSSGTNKKRERTEFSYVRGAYKKTNKADRLAAKSLYLRDENDFSLILGVFFNKDLNETLTLAQLRWFSNHNLKKQFIISPFDLNIQSHFLPIDPKGKWKKPLEDKFKAKFCANFNPYCQKFSKKFGLKSEKALTLFSQTAGIKELNNLNAFIRNHMLEERNVEETFQNLTANLQNLDKMHRAIAKASIQLKLLQPVMESGKKYENQAKDSERLERLKETVIPWFSREKTWMLKKALRDNQSMMEKVRAKTAVMEETIKALEKKKEELIIAISRDQAAIRLQTIEARISRLEKEVYGRKKNMEKYNRLARILQVSENPDHDRFHETISRLQALKSQIQVEIRQLMDIWGDLKSEKNKLEDAHEECVNELKSLRHRKSNIPDMNLRIRKKISDHLEIREDELPFAGELIRVKEDELDWENAIEILLHNFGQRFLVTEKQYAVVNRFVNQTDLKGRVGYYKVSDRIVPKPFDTKTLEDALLNKLDMKSDNHFCQWIRHHIEHCLDYICAGSPDDFSRLDRALTKEGLIKDRDRHEKDDRHKSKKRSHYVLGWDNTQKIRMLQKDAKILDDAIKETEEKIRVNDKTRKEMDTRRDNLNSLSNFEKFIDLDWQSPAAEIEDLKSEKSSLEESSNQLKSLQDEKRQVEFNLSGRKKEQEDLNRQRYRIESDSGRWEKEITSNLRNIEPFSDSDLDEMTDSLSPHIEKTGIKPDLNNFDQIKEDVYSEIEKAYTYQRRKTEKTKNSLVKHMWAYKNVDDMIKADHPGWTAETQNLGADPSHLSEYRQVFKRIETEDLPGYQDRFKKYLENDVVLNIVSFKTELDSHVDEIRKGIRSINESLKEIDYSPSPPTYLRILDKDDSDVRIREFISMIKEAIPDQWSLVLDNEQELETAYLSINRLIEKMKSDDAWRRYVTDVRNWRRFGAEERFREDDNQKQYYEDSQSLSGGEKAKLAYTILASAIAYQFGIQQKRFTPRSLRFVVVDEAFSKVDPENAVYALELFKRLNLQLMVVTPLDKINITEKYVKAVHYVHNRHDRDSEVINMPIEEYLEKKAAFNHGKSPEKKDFAS